MILVRLLFVVFKEIVVLFNQLSQLNIYSIKLYRLYSLYMVQTTERKNQVPQMQKYCTNRSKVKADLHTEQPGGGRF